MSAVYVFPAFLRHFVTRQKHAVKVGVAAFTADNRIERHGLHTPVMLAANVNP